MHLLRLSQDLTDLTTRLLRQHRRLHHSVHRSHLKRQKNQLALKQFHYRDAVRRCAAIVRR